MIGRDDEVRAVEAFLGAIDGPPAALVVAAEPGMGKTLVWQHAVDLARGRGTTVLVARALERELDLPYAVLADLIGPLFATHGPVLPDPQRAVLSAVLLEADPGAALDLRAVGTAVVGLLVEAAATSPVLIAIDDEPWIDAASRDALCFAIRRLSDRTRLIVARRMPDDAAATALDLSLPSESRSRIDLRAVRVRIWVSDPRAARPAPRPTAVRGGAPRPTR